MNLESHVAELEEKHKKLEAEIEAQLLRPAIDTLQLSELKRRKLHLKDAISKLRTDTPSTQH